MSALTHDLNLRYELVLATLTLGIAIVLWAVRRLRGGARRVAESERRYRALAEASPAGVYVVADGKLKYANAAASELWGAAAPETLIGREILTLLHPDDHEVVRARLAAVLDHGHRTTLRVIKLRGVDGSTREVEARGTRIDFDGFPAVLVVARDISERRSAELALTLSEQRLRAVLGGVAEGVVLQNVGGEIELWNPAAERILGLSADEMAGRTSFDPHWMATDNSGAELRGDEHYAMVALRTGRSTAGDMGLKRPNGTRAWLHVSATPLFHPHESRPYGVVATFTDITEARAAARRLEESMTTYRLLADNSADMVSRRSLDHRFEYISPSHTTILGWSEAELIGRVAFELVHPDDRQRVETVSAARIQAGMSSPPIEVRVRHKAGHYVWVEATGRPFQDAAGVVTGYTVSSRDITTRRHLEYELRQSQKMEAMGRMASGVAHDINNLLTVIRSAGELLGQPASAGTTVAEANEYVAELNVAIDRVAGLTGQLLKFSHGQHSIPRLLSIAAVLRDSKLLMERLTSERASLELRIEPEAERAAFWGEPDEIAQVLLNLVVNAVDAMSDRGTVLVDAGAATLTQTLAHRFGTITPGDYLTLAVQDSGVGMTEATMEHIFEPFYTTKPHGKGTGLGLSTAWGIVQQAHGSIVVNSVPGRGSRFTIYWPRERELAGTVDVTDSSQDTSLGSVQNRRQPHRTQRATRGATKTLLVVDDEPAVLRMVSCVLELMGFQVQVASSGAEALQLLQLRGVRVDAIITDVRMPEMTGVELVSKLIANGIDLPVLFISGQLDAPLPSAWPGTVPRRFLAKPFAAQQLNHAIEQLFATAGTERVHLTN